MNKRRRAIMGIATDNPYGTPGLAYTLSNDGTYYMCSGIGTATETDIVIGSIHEGLPVKAIKNDAFNGNSSITGCIIPDTIIDIYPRAFKSCTNLSYIKLSQSLTALSGEIFRFCGSLTEIELPENLTQIGDSDVFGSCGLQQITIPDSVTSIGVACFSYCTVLNKVILSNTLSQIRDFTFLGDNALNRIIFRGATPPTIGAAAFAGANNIIYVYVNYSGINSYKVAQGLSDYATKMYPLVNTVSDLSSIDTTEYTKACVIGNKEYTEYIYNNGQWEIV